MDGSRLPPTYRSLIIATALLMSASCQLAPGTAQPQPTPIAATAEPAAFADTLAAHNRWRADVGTPPLGWSDRAAEFAQAWADTLAREKDCAPEHSPGDARRQLWGENIFHLIRGGAYEGYRRTAPEVVDRWASEREWYDGQRHRCNAPDGEVCSHYTQVVSTYTTHVGCGRARCERQEIWVCSYSPPGNFVGLAPY